MKDVNDFWVNDNCQTNVHSRGYVFTIAELVDIAISRLDIEELAKHVESAYKNLYTGENYERLDR